MNVGTGASSWFSGSGSIYNVYFANIGFYSANANSQFWHQPLPGTLYACTFDTLGFFGFKSVFGSSTEKAAVTQVRFSLLFFPSILSFPSLSSISSLPSLFFPPFFFSLLFFSLPLLFTLLQVNFKGQWTVIAGYDTQFNLGGSDCELWTSGYLNIGPGTV